MARALKPEGLLVVTSDYYFDSAWEQPSFLAMVGLVALVVAIVILVFFGIGYLFGRVFL